MLQLTEAGGIAREYPRWSAFTSAELIRMSVEARDSTTAVLTVATQSGDLLNLQKRGTSVQVLRS